MKATMTSTEMFKYILLFTILFAAFLALAITYNRVYKVKNETISIIEKYEGATSKALAVVNNYLYNSGYVTKGQCKLGEKGAKSLEDTTLETVTNESERYFYCLSDYVVLGENIDRIYYNIKLFYKFNLPVIGELLTFNITGESKGIEYYDAKQKL